MNISELFDEKELQRLIDEKYISRRKHPTSDLYIYNYTNKAQFDRIWTPETLGCRGLIADGSGKIIARPFQKFFNFGENGVDKFPEEDFEVYEKMDGSLGILYIDNWIPRIATRGSFDSEQARWASDFYTKNHNASANISPEVTYLFEIIYPENRVVVDYGNRRELVLLAAIVTATGEELDINNLTHLGFPIVKRYDGINDYNQIVAMENDKDEGVVVHFKQSNTRMKIKFAEYKRLHRLLTGVSEKTIWEHLMTTGTIEPIIERVPDEFYDWAREVEQRLRSQYNYIYEKSAHDLLAINHKIANNKTIDFSDAKLIKKLTAEEVLKCQYPHVMFSMMGNKEISTQIWKMIKPNSEKVFKIEL